MCIPKPGYLLDHLDHTWLNQIPCVLFFVLSHLLMKTQEAERILLKRRVWKSDRFNPQFVVPRFAPERWCWLIGEPRYWLPFNDYLVLGEPIHGCCSADVKMKWSDLSVEYDAERIGLIDSISRWNENLSENRRICICKGNRDLGTPPAQFRIRILVPLSPTPSDILGIREPIFED
jgi:hypothetical protein